ncbi:MAG TPA: DUF2497 domain-containing protein, partial [Stellaceae bacterium]|nr:DUF2497 domain-containing protein [Stellaceae bacterium]
APPQSEPTIDPAVRDHVLSAAAAGAAAAAFGRLAATPRAPEEEERREGGNTLEAIVRDALRPLLRSWLNEHLPELAERLAREEVARVLQRAGLR